MNLIQVGILALCLGLSGCASNRTTNASQQDKVEGFHCLKENRGNEDACLSEQQKQSVGLKCEEVEVTGSRFRKRGCTTQAQRDARSGNAKEAAQRMRDSGKSNITKMGN
ncbi:hypothetical protein [Bowmanella denitrificans]|uniref:hypothetical protein n=1 Tax=Bowmanella denitrificans TaxID=366582 RepID=UPI000C9AEE32|nr:hypothetical protein [Bowmanella denitrificans]